MRSTATASRLARLLGGGAAVGEDGGTMDVAERLSVWLNAFDAIHLQAAHQQLRGLGAAPAAGTTASRARVPDLPAQLQQVRAVLARAIAQDPLKDGADAGYAPWQQRHLELQRHMEQMTGALREQARQALARGSQRLRQLAALDAAMERIVAPREQALLPAAPALLKRRFEELRATEEGPQAFLAEWREALQAELELRLAPVAGLVAALGNEQERT